MATSWYNDPQTWAALAQIAAAYKQSTAKGDIKFKQVPQTPEELAAYNYAATLAGVPNVNGTQRPGAMPSMSFVGPQITSALQNYQNLFADYKPLDYLDPVTGKPVPRATTPFQAFDFSKAVPPWGGPAAAAAAPTPGQATNQLFGWNGQGTPPWTNVTGGVEPQVKGDPRVPSYVPAEGGGPGSLIQSPQTFDPNTRGAAGGLDFSAVSNWFRNYAANNPNWMKNAAGAASALVGAFNLPLGLALKVVQYFMPNRTAPLTTPPYSGYNPTAPNGGVL